MQFKLQLTNNSGDDPKYWNNYRNSIQANNIYDALEMINEGLIDYHAVYVIDDDVISQWNDYILFATEADHFLFMLAWS
jgi:hypothetical protein